MLRRMVKNPWETVRFRKNKRKGEILEVKMLDGRNLFLRAGYNDFHLFHRIYMKDEYNIAEFFHEKWECVIDLGANVGIFAAYISDIANRVVAYEPYPENFLCMKRNVEKRENVIPVCKAVSSKEEVLRLFRPVDESLSSVNSSFPEKDGLMSEKYDEVPAITLEQLFSEHEIDHCDLLKIDVEGMEYDILYATGDNIFERIDRIHGEYHNVEEHDFRTRISNFVSFLEEKGYSVRVEPHQRKENIGMFFARKIEL
jgi:FkbM family methyltransferase